MRARSLLAGAAATVLAGATLWAYQSQAHAAAGATIYVSPSGDDANAGTSATQPVKTLQKARDLVRARTGGMTADITVSLADGTYQLSQPLTLDARDRSEEHTSELQSRVDLVC